MTVPSFAFCRLVPLISMCILYPVGSIADMGNVRFSSVTTTQGLAGREVRSILQDRRGFLWFGTEAGLNRYDGTNFTLFKHDPLDARSIAQDDIQTICEDSTGALWVGTGHGLDKFDRTTETFTHFIPDSTNPSALPSFGIITLMVDHSGTLWVGSWEGLSRYDPKTGAFQTYSLGSGNRRGPRALPVYAIYDDTSGTRRYLWIGTGTQNSDWGGLRRFDPESGTFTEYDCIPSDSLSLRNNWVTAVHRDRQGRLWVGTNDGLERFNDSSGTFVHVRLDRGRPAAVRGTYLKAIYEDHSGDIWVGTWGGGLIRYTPAANTFTRYMPSFMEDGSLSSSNVLFLCEDRSGVLWIGTSGGGACALVHPSRRFETYVHASVNKRTIQDNDVRVLLEDRSGTLFVGTSTGLDVLDRNTGSFSRFAPWDPPPYELNGLLEDRTGVLWTGVPDGLNMVVRTPYRRTFYNPLDGGIAEKFLSAVSSITETPDGILYMLMNPAGVCTFDRVTGTFTALGIGGGRRDRATSQILVDAAVGHGWILWMSTHDGLVRYDVRARASTVFSHDPKNSKSVASNTVYCLYQETGGTLWIGTDRGLNRMDRSTHTFELWSEKDGLASNRILGILQDDRGRIWVGTNKGISRIDPGERRVTNYDLRDGLSENQFTPGCCLRLSSGDMLFGGRSGLTRFHPDSIRDNPFVPPIVITGFRKSDVPFALDTAITEKHEIELSHDDLDFAFEFAALNYTHPDKNQYAYTLEGRDHDWIYCGTQQYARFLNLPPGEYVFRVKGSNNDGMWNETGASIAVIVHPPYWETWWFRTVVFLLALGLVGGSVRYLEITRLRRRMQALEQQEALERERVRIAGDLHDELASNLTSIAMLSRILHDGSSDVDPDNAQRSHVLERISSLSSESVESIRDIIWAIDPKSETVEGLLVRLHDLLTSLCRARSIRLRFEQPAAGTLPAFNLAPEFRRHLWLLLKEATNNALKHSGCTEMSIAAAYGDGTLRLCVKDNGQGFDPTAAAEGKGLRTMAMRTRQLGGTLEHASTPGEGTTITISVPLSG